MEMQGRIFFYPILLCTSRSWRSVLFFLINNSVPRITGEFVIQPVIICDRITFEHNDKVHCSQEQ